MRLIALLLIPTIAYSNAENRAVKTSIRAISKTPMVKRIKIPKSLKKYGPILGIIKKDLRYKYKWGKLKVENRLRFKKGEKNVEASITYPF